MGGGHVHAVAVMSNVGFPCIVRTEQLLHIWFAWLACASPPSHACFWFLAGHRVQAQALGGLGRLGG
ncbi:hypothetical protein CH063_14423 [Colletotrichum higginsianum]|uniref:Uncharacterized protein n=1 Tax=Colletotrichum higginsianum (strain IMI 349063) TaxID=759273 RepID=H1VYI3_COLHI|nr:hypothetical protein CH063_14423 [Colletotrichum higginsianum]